MANAMDNTVILSIEEYDELQSQIDSLTTKLHQAMGALGFPVPGDIPESNLKCGLCASKERSLFEASVEYTLLMKIHKLTLETMAKR